MKGAACLLLGGTHGAIFAAEVMHHHAIGVAGERAARQRDRQTLWCCQQTQTVLHFEISLLPVSDLLFADSAGLLVCDDTFDLLVENSLLLHLKSQRESPDIAADAIKTFHLKINIQSCIFFFTNMAKVKSFSSATV